MGGPPKVEVCSLERKQALCSMELRFWGSVLRLQDRVEGPMIRCSRFVGQRLAS